MSELVVGSIAGLAANSYVVSIASGSTLDLANAKASSLPESALAFDAGDMVLLASETVSSGSTLSLSNFMTDDYPAYRVYFKVTGNAALIMRMRLSQNGTNITDAVYKGSGFYYAPGGGTGTFDAGTTRTQIQLCAVDAGSPYEGTAVVDILRTPGGADVWLHTQGQDAAASGFVRSDLVRDQTNVNGISIYSSTSTWNGTVHVYGVKG